MISRFIIWLASRMSMTYVRNLFFDKVNGRVVKLYVDCFGDEYMAQSKYGFRVKK